MKRLLHKLYVSDFFVSNAQKLLHKMTEVQQVVPKTTENISSLDCYGHLKLSTVYRVPSNQDQVLRAMNHYALVLKSLSKNQFIL